MSNRRAFVTPSIGSSQGGTRTPQRQAPTSEEAAWHERVRRLAQEEEQDKMVSEANRRLLQGAMAEDLEAQVQFREQQRREARHQRDEDLNAALRAAGHHQMDQLQAQAQHAMAKERLARDQQNYKNMHYAMHPEGGLAKKLERNENLFMQRAYELMAEHGKAVEKYYHKCSQYLMNTIHMKQVDEQHAQRRMKKLEDEIAIKRAELDMAENTKYHHRLDNEAAKKKHELKELRELQRAGAANATVAMNEQVQKARDANTFTDKPYPFANSGAQNARQVQLMKQQRLREEAAASGSGGALSGSWNSGYSSGSVSPSTTPRGMMGGISPRGMSPQQQGLGILPLPGVNTSPRMGGKGTATGISPRSVSPRANAMVQLAPLSQSPQQPPLGGSPQQMPIIGQSPQSGRIPQPPSPRYEGHAAEQQWTRQLRHGGPSPARK